jgi:hypothetical protein
MLWTIIVILVVLWLLGLYRPLWRRSDSSPARDCRHRARYSADSRQTALSESVFAQAVISSAILTIGFARLSFNTACELGFRGSLDEWERLMGAVARR